MKKFLLLFLFACIYNASNAQISSRLNDSTAYRFGVRPVKGTKVLTFGYDINNEWVNPLNLFKRGDLLTGKYFISDYLAIRGGIRLSKDTRMSSGNVDTAITGGSLMSNNLRTSATSYVFVPGIEKHFDYSNIFDVYAGGDLYLGFGRNTRREDYDYTDNYYYHSRRTTPNTIMGLGGVIGVNFFILDLPLSVGFEYGWTALWNFGGRTKVVEKVNDPLGPKTYEYYQQETDAFENPDTNSYSSLSKSSSSIDTNNNFRLILNLYFR